MRDRVAGRDGDDEDDETRGLLRRWLGSADELLRLRRADTAGKTGGLAAEQDLGGDRPISEERHVD